MKKGWFLLLAMSLGLNAGLIATRAAGDRDSRPRHRPRTPEPGAPAAMVDNHLQGMVAHLDLDLDQQAVVRAVLERGLPQIASRRRELQEAERRIRDAYGAASFDAEGFAGLVAQAATARAAIDSLTAAMLVEEAAILSTDQRRLFAEVAVTVYGGQQAGPGRPVGPPPGPPPREHHQRP